MMPKKLSFEDGLAELDRIVQELERGELSLEDSMKSYEKAKQLEAQLRNMLDQMDARIRVLTEDGEEPFVEGDGDVETE